MYWPMANQLKILSRNLAKNLDALRRSNGMTQADLSKAAGLPRSTITNLESGDGNPSLENMAKLASTFGISLDELLAEPRAQCQLIAARDIPVRNRSGGTVQVQRLLPDPIPGLEIDRFEMDVGSRLAGVPHLAGTKEYLTCSEGAVSVYVAGEIFEVKTGDVLAFPGDQAHSYKNTAATKAICYSVVAIAAMSPQKEPTKS